MRRVAILAVVAAALAAYLLVFDRDRGRDAGMSGRLVERFDRSAVRQVTITRAGAAPLSLTRQAAGSEPAWRLEPGGQAADGAAVDDLLGAIDVAEPARTADLQPAAAGLVPPRVTLTIDEQPGGTIALQLGRPDATGTGVFATTGKGRVQVAPRRLLELTDRDPSAFRDRRLFPVAADAVTAIDWPDRAGGAARALRLTDGRWRNDRGDFAAGERVAEALRQALALRVERYLPAPPTAAGGAPLLEVTAAGARIDVAMGSESCPVPDTLSVIRTGALGRDGACLDETKLRALAPVLEAAWAADRRLLAAAPDTVTTFALEGGGRRVALARAAGGWRFTAPSVAYAADPRVVDDWLATLHATNLPPEPAAGGGATRRLTADGRQVATVGPKSPAYALLAPDPLRFRDRAALDFAHFDARDLRRTADSAVELASADGDSWRAVAPADAHVDGANVARVVSALGNLRAVRFLTAAPAGRSDLKLEVSVQPPGETAPTRHTLELWPARPTPEMKAAPDCVGRLDSETILLIPSAACHELRLPVLAASPSR